ncbi:MAG TPA: cyclopropane-fatty-acyl-phospholipid synthase family protein [Trebonia sp.]
MTSTQQRASTTRIIDPADWPDVATVRGSAARAQIARVLFRSAVARLPLRMRLPDGRELGAGGPGTPVMVVHDPAAFYTRLGSGGLIGFGESYLAGEWDCADLTGLLTVFATRVGDLVPVPLQRMRRLAVRRHPAADEQNRDGARRNISRHYDLSNEFFALFLDETMTYSSARFEAGPDGLPAAAGPRPGEAAGPLLVTAQRRKIDQLLDAARVGPGTRLLEIGTGWGELAIRAGQRGADVRTVTISARQRELAAQRVAEAGLAGRVSVELRDYRDVDGEFDAICSVEMIEAVGERYWDTYFTQLDRLLAPGGRVGLQAITMPHDRMVASRNTYTWIHKYIFPGGLIPSVTAIEDSLARCTRLRVTSRQDFGAHYARTLSIWRDRFLARGTAVAALGFDEVFARMWQFYLCYSEAGFEAGYLDVSQFTLERA